MLVNTDKQTSFAIRQAIFQVEVTVAKQPSAVGTRETLWVKLLANSVEAFSFDALRASSASRSQVIFEAGLAI